MSVISFFILFEKMPPIVNLSRKRKKEMLASVVMRRSHHDVAVVKEEEQLHPLVNKFVSISVVLFCHFGFCSTIPVF